MGVLGVLICCGMGWGKRIEVRLRSLGLHCIALTPHSAAPATGPASNEEAKGQEEVGSNKKAAAVVAEEEGEEEKPHPLAGSAHSSGSGASGGSAESDGFEVVGQR